MKSILWSIDTRDWYTAAVDTADIIAAANDNMHEEAIILMHDGGGNRQNTLNAVQSIINHYQANGYEFVTVDQMLGISKYL
jgi:peptidoglycan/xylan/chitin deacetylase (PgdA/CDA1 family)